MRIYIFIFFLFYSLSSSAFSYPIITDKVEGSLSLLPFASWFAEPESAIGITNASDPKTQKNYLPVGKSFGLKEKGAGWLRLEFKKSSPATNLLSQSNTGDLFLKVGGLPPGTSSIYYQDNLDPTKTPGIWFATILHAFESRQLPEPPLSGNVVYIHFEETPGLWFTPTLEKDSKIPFVFPSDTALIGFLLCGAIVCLLRSIKDKVLWPLWASFLLGLGFIQVVLPLSPLSKQLELRDIPPLIAPGLCLIIFPHLVRLMLRTKESSPAQDTFLKIFPFLGVLVSLVPLLPEYNWLTRLFPLWTLFLFPLLLICLRELSLKKPGSLILTGACLLPILGAVWALSSLFMENIHPLAEEGGLWGLAIGGIFLFLASVPKEQKNEVLKATEEDIELVTAKSTPLNKRNNTPLVSPSTLLLPFDEDKNLETQKIESEQIKNTDFPPLFSDKEKSGKEDLTNISLPAEKAKEQSFHLDRTTQLNDSSASLDKESSFNKPTSIPSIQTTTSSTKVFGSVSSLFHEENSLPPPFKEKKDIQSEKTTTEESVLTRDEVNPDLSKDSSQIEQDQNKTSFASNLTTSIANINEEPLEEREKENTKIISLKSEDFSDTEWEKQASLMRASVPVGENYIFSLHTLVRDIHNMAMPLAEDKDILLSWFISPSIPSFLKGDVVSLRQALSLLIQNAVQATNKGAVQLFVKHAPNTAVSELGHLQFTISDTGVAQRADSGFFHAWELAQRTGGYFSIEYSVSGGTLIIFSAKFDIPSDESLQKHLYLLPEENAEQTLSNPHESYSKAFPLTQQLINTFDSNSSEAVLEAPFDIALEMELDPSLPLFIIADMTISNKRLLSHYLASIPHSTIDPKSIAGVLEIVQKTNPSLVIYDADSPEDIIASSMHAIIEWRRQQGITLLPQLVIAGHEEQAKRMQKAGATRVLLKPFSQEEILEILNEFFPLEQNIRAEQSGQDVNLITHNQSQKTILSQEEKNKETVVEPKEHIQKGAQKDQSSTNKLPTKKIEVKTTSSSPFDFATPEQETQAAPLIQSLSKEDLQADLAASKTSLEQKPKNVVENKTNAIQEEKEELSSKKEDTKKETEVPEQNNKKKEIKQVVTTFDAPPAKEKKIKEEDEQIKEESQVSQPVSKLEEAGDLLFGPAPTGNYPLPGMEGETIEIVMLPLLPGLLNTLEDTLADSLKARKEHQTLFIQEAVSRLANKAEVFGLERLGKIARCVERAAEADDFEAVDTLLDDLILVTGRYIESLKKGYNSFLSEAR